MTPASLEATQDALYKVGHVIRRGHEHTLILLSSAAIQRNARRATGVLTRRPKMKMNANDPIQDPLPNRLQVPEVISQIYQSFPRRAQATQEEHMKEFRKYIQEITAYDYIGGDKLGYRMKSRNYDVGMWVNAWEAFLREKRLESAKPPGFLPDTVAEDRRETGQLLSAVTDEIMAQLPESIRPVNKTRKPLNVIA